MVSALGDQLGEQPEVLEAPRRVRYALQYDRQAFSPCGGDPVSVEDDPVRHLHRDVRFIFQLLRGSRRQFENGRNKLSFERHLVVSTYSAYGVEPRFRNLKSHQKVPSLRLGGKTPFLYKMILFHIGIVKHVVHRMTPFFLHEILYI